MREYMTAINPIGILLLGCSALGTLGAGCGDDDDGAPAQTASAEGTPDTSLPGDPAAGDAVYHRVCIACHAADGHGNGGVTGADLAGDPTRLAKDNAVLIDHITNGILNKTPPMPPQGSVLSEQEIKDALSYVRQTFGGTH